MKLKTKFSNESLNCYKATKGLINFEILVHIHNLCNQINNCRNWVPVELHNINTKPVD